MGFKLRLSNWVTYILTVTFSQAFSQVHNSMQDRSFTSGSTTVKYRLFVPKNYDPSKKYPFIVTMHGVGEKGNDNTRQLTLKIWSPHGLQTKFKLRTPFL